MSISLLQFIPAAILIIVGVAVMMMGTLGVFRIKYVLNRMHAAAMGDSLGILLIALGVAVIFGLSWVTLKIMLVVLLLWVASPTCSHLLAGFEVSTNEHIEEHCEMIHRDAGGGPCEGNEEQKMQKTSQTQDSNEQREVPQET